MIYTNPRLVSHTLTKLVQTGYHLFQQLPRGEFGDRAVFVDGDDGGVYILDIAPNDSYITISYCDLSSNTIFPNHKEFTTLKQLILSTYERNEND